ncbi:MAG: hypothetical protein IT461_04155 [Planctomycetes bacterium]|nr:hypothetical protein [Planctomycetota bacterium]
MPAEQAIRDLLKEFCLAMHKWAGDSHADYRRWRKDLKGGALPTTHPYWIAVEDRKRDLREIFCRYCTEWKSPGRSASFSVDDYDPEHFVVLDVTVRADTATARVKQSEFPGKLEVAEYFLRRVKDEWRLEDRRRWVDLEGNVVQDWDSL